MFTSLQSSSSPALQPIAVYLGELPPPVYKWTCTQSKDMTPQQHKRLSAQLSFNKKD